MYIEAGSGTGGGGGWFVVLIVGLFYLFCCVWGCACSHSLILLIPIVKLIFN